MIPKRFTAAIRDIWILQHRLPRFGGKRAQRVYAHEKFRAAFDFLALRARVEQSRELAELTAWWEEYQLHNKLPEHQYARQNVNKAKEYKPEANQPTKKRRYSKAKRKPAPSKSND